MNGTLCPELNPSALLRVEYRRGAGAQHGGSTSSVPAARGGGGFAGFGAAPPVAGHAAAGWAPAWRHPS